MTIYLDAVFFLNFYFDFILLLTVSITLKLNTKLSRLIIGSLIGSLSFFSLFINFTTITLFLFKILLSLVIIIVTFGTKKIISCLSYFYMTSTVLGGFLYFLNLSFSESHQGLIFTYQNYSISFLFLIIISPIILYIYYKQRKKLIFYAKLMKVSIKLKNGKILNLNGFIDTGNNLIDPITNKKIILISKKLLKGIVKINKPIYVAYESLNNHGLLKCLSLSYLEINGIRRVDYLLGISENNLIKNDVECVLNAKCEEDFL